MNYLLQWNLFQSPSLSRNATNLRMRRIRQTQRLRPRITREERPRRHRTPPRPRTLIRAQSRKIIERLSANNTISWKAAAEWGTLVGDDERAAGFLIYDAPGVGYDALGVLCFAVPDAVPVGVLAGDYLWGREELALHCYAGGEGWC